MFVQLWLAFYFISYGNAQGRVLTQIIDILAENPRTRSMFVNAIRARNVVPPQFGVIRPVIDQNYLYKLAGRKVPVLKISSKGAYLKMEDKPPVYTPHYSNTKYIDDPNEQNKANRPLVVQTKPPSPCAPAEPLPGNPPNTGTDCATQTDAAKTPSGVALDVNGDMKANIPIEDKYTTVSVRQPLSDDLFQKKRAIIKELKSLFQVVLGTHFPSRSRRHKKRFHGHVKEYSPIRNITEAEGSKRGGISGTPVHKTSRRIVLYKKLINDLNDLITLEISKNNRTNSFEGVEQLAPVNLRQTIPQPEAGSE